MKKAVVLLVLLVLCMAGALAEDHMPLILKPGVYELEYSVMEDGTVMVAQCWGIPVELEIPEQIDGRPVTAIRDGAFVNDYYLTCVDLPDTLVSIGEDAFANCINLKEIVLPDGLKKIGSGVFESCRMLESIRIPDGLEEIGTNPFADCPVLVLDVSPEHPLFSWEDGALFLKEEKRLISFLGKQKTYILPQDTLTVGAEAFSGSEVEEVQLPDGLQTIEACAFCDCKKLKKICLPDSVENLGKNAFLFCDALEKVNIPVTVEQVEAEWFRGCEMLSEISLAEGHPNYILQDGVLFSGDGSILVWYPAGKPQEEYQAPAGVRQVADFAFHSSANLKKVIFPEGTESIGMDAFSCGLKLEEVICPESLNEIEKYAFYNCRALERVVLPREMQTIGEGAFCDCSALMDVQLPDGLTMLDEYLFCGCVALKEIVVPEGVQTLCEAAFYDCGELKITLPASLKTIEWDTFKDTKLQVIRQEGQHFLNAFPEGTVFLEAEDKE